MDKRLFINHDTNYKYLFSSSSGMPEHTLFAFHKLKVYKDKPLSYSVKIGEKVVRSDYNKSNVHYLANAQRSARRCWQQLMDIVGENMFTFFITLTFSSDIDVVENRLDDKLTYSLFSKWRKAILRKYPSLYYIAVPEYHKKGGIHFHLLVGGVTANDLQLVESGSAPCKFNGEEIPVYNVNAWNYGFSTATYIQSQEACEHYLAKYVTKGDVDPRFFGKKRYWCSQNLIRPDVVTYAEPISSFSIEEFEQLSGLQLERGDELYQCYKFAPKSEE